MDNRIKLKDVLILNINGGNLPSSNLGYIEYFCFEEHTVNNETYWGGCKIINTTQVIEYTKEECKIIADTKMLLVNLLRKGLIKANGIDASCSSNETTEIDAKYWSSDNIINWDHSYFKTKDGISFRHITLNKEDVDRDFFSKDHRKKRWPEKINKYIKNLPKSINTMVAAREDIRKHFKKTKDDPSFSDGALSHHLRNFNKLYPGRFTTSPKGNFKRKN